MASAATLVEAAETAYENIWGEFVAGTLQAALASFVDDLLPTFPDDAVGGRPVADWLVLIDALQNDMNPAAQNDYSALRNAAVYLFKLCWMTNQLQTQNDITGAQAAAVLTAYNDNF